MNYAMKGGMTVKRLFQLRRTVRQRLGSNLKYNDVVILMMQSRSISHHHVTNGRSIHVSNEVSQALRNCQPVVALESTIITHGMPWPVNLETAFKVEDIIRFQGAVPATIGIIKGQVIVGLSRDQLEDLASKKDPCFKTSRRDFPYVLSQGLNGGTTVSGTMLVAHKAGIPIFVTGGIGGVHRGAEQSFDVSADLTELGRTNVAVVSSGVKSILDIGKTLEYLETEGVCVATLGPQGSDFPAFYSRHSGFQAPHRVSTATEAAGLVRFNMGAVGGLLIAVPIPEAHAADGLIVEEAIGKALSEANQLGIRGAHVTPFLLERVNRLTSGASLIANRALIEHNASVGAEIAVQLARQLSSSSTTTTTPRPTSPSQSYFQNEEETFGRRVTTTKQEQQQQKATRAHDCSQTVVIGGSIVDLVAAVQEDSIRMDGSTHRGTIRRSYGGVGRNLADALTRLGCKPLFVSVVGEDAAGRELIHHNPTMERRGIMRLASASTASYVVVLDSKGDFKFGIGDMNIHHHLTIERVKQYEEDLARCRLVVMDGNLAPETINYILGVCSAAQVPVWYEPTDVHKASKPFLCRDWSALAYTSPNLAELKRIVEAVRPSLKKDVECIDPQKLHNIEEIRKPVTESCRPLLETMNCIMVTLGQHGMMIVRRGGNTDKLPLAPWNIDHYTALDNITCTHYPAPVVDNVVSVSGAGDCLAAGFISGVLSGWDQNRCAALGLKAAGCSVQYSPAVPEALSNLLTS